MVRRVGKTAALALMFLLVGEVLIRVQQTNVFFAGTGVEVVRTDFLPSEELRQLDEGRFVPQPGDLRIMVLGDSKVRGLGVPYPEIASVRLEQALLREGSQIGHRIHVLNLSRPGNNTLQNKLTFLKYYKAYKPQVVLLAYNIDDVYGDNLEDDSKSAGSPAGSSAASTHAATAPQLHYSFLDRMRNVVHDTQNFIFHAQVLQYGLTQLNMQLKLTGLVVPGTEFYHLVREAYRPDSPGWVLSQRHLAEMIDDCKADGITFVVYIVPQLEMLAHPHVFDDANATLERFFASHGVETIDGLTPFLGSDSSQYAVSRYDGHPNAKAHAIIARQWGQSLTPVLRQAAVRMDGSIRRARASAEPTTAPLVHVRVGG